MARQDNTNSALDFIFKTPRKLLFSNLYRYYFDYILRLLYRIILIKNVPDSINETFMKLILYTQGKISFLEAQKIGEEGEQLLSLNCSRADTPDVYYIPRKIIVTNPRLKKSYNLTPGKDCTVVYLSEADKYNLAEMNGGLYHLISRTATMLADNDISLNIAQKNTRLVNLVSGDTQNTVDSIKAVIASMYEGDPTIVVKSSLIDKLQGIPILQNSTNNNIVDLIEVNQYILSHFLEQIGVNGVHDQMKRERLVTGELNDNITFAFLSIDDIIVSLNKGFEETNAMYGTELEAEINPLILQQREASAENETADNLAGEPSTNDEDENPEEDASPEPDEEREPEPAAELEEEAAPEEEEAATEDPEEPEEPEEEAAPEEEEAAPEDQSVEINIDGDNNIIIVGGDDVGDLETTEDALQNVERDNPGND